MSCRQLSANVQQASICLVHPQQGAHTVTSKREACLAMSNVKIDLMQYQDCRGTAAVPWRRKPAPVSVINKSNLLFISLQHTSLQVIAGFISNWLNSGRIQSPGQGPMAWDSCGTQQQSKGQAAQLCPKKNPDVSAAHLSPHYEHHDGLFDSPYVMLRIS